MLISCPGLLATRSSLILANSALSLAWLSPPSRRLVKTRSLRSRNRLSCSNNRTRSSRGAFTTNLTARLRSSSRFLIAFAKCWLPDASTSSSSRLSANSKASSALRVSLKVNSRRIDSAVYCSKYRGDPGPNGWASASSVMPPMTRTKSTINAARIINIFFMNRPKFPVR